MINTQTLKGNFTSQDYTMAFTLSQGDKGVPFKVELLENGTPYTLLPDDVVTIEWLKPNGSAYLQEGNIKYGTNYIEFTTPEAISQYAGSGTFNIIISDGTVRKGTIRREYKVVATSMTPGSVSEDVITDAMTELRELNSTLAATIQTGNLDNYAKKTYVNKEVELINSSLEEITKQEPLHYYVGKNQKYKTITDAINVWVNMDSRQQAIIHIFQGEYNEVIHQSGARNISFIGEDKTKVIWRTKTGYYKDSPLSIQGGNVLIKGITFIADHTENPDYTYKELSSGNPGTDEIGGAYALHVDFDGSGKTTIEDCILISYQNAGLGSGCRQDQEIVVKNTDIYSYTPANMASLRYGSLLYHTYNGTAENQKITLNNVTVFSENGKSLVHQNITTGLGGSETTVINCNFYSNSLGSEDSVEFLNGVNLTSNSFGNNVTTANYINPQMSNLTDVNGMAIAITNCNDITSSGVYVCDGTATGTHNTPTAEWYIIEDVRTTVSDVQYGIQYAWQFTNHVNLPKYRRVLKNDGTFTAWETCQDTPSPTSYSTMITDYNNITSSGFFQTSTNASNAPSASAHHVISVMANSSYGYLIATQMSDTSVQYKRSKVAGTWGEWTTI